MRFAGSEVGNPVLGKAHFQLPIIRPGQIYFYKKVDISKYGEWIVLFP